MALQTYIVNAFVQADPFSGNPAAVCLLDRPRDARWMQQVAQQNNLSETAFVCADSENWQLRWFTPAVEVDLCGHATLATAHVLLTELERNAEEVRFSSNSGPLSVSLDDEHGYAMDFPTQTLADEPDAKIRELLAGGLGCAVKAVCRGGQDIVVELASQQAVANLVPDLDLLGDIDCRGIVATAGGDSVDFVSRFFGPRCGVPEDPVTGSAHCALAPYWGEKLGKVRMSARQLSARGGALSVEWRTDRVILRGQCRTFLRGSVAADYD